MGVYPNGGPGNFGKNMEHIRKYELDNLDGPFQKYYKNGNLKVEGCFKFKKYEEVYFFIFYFIFFY